LPSPPPVSVVLPVLNGGRFLHRSLESVRAQTHADFELVVLDNGSTDGSVEWLREQADLDPRIRLHEAPAPLGIAGSSNAVTRLARAPLVARVDQDDECVPDRLERQLAVLADEPDAVAVGSVYEGIDERGRRVRPPDRRSLVAPGFRPPFTHGTLMFRREAFEWIGGYDDHGSWSDLDFILRLAAAGPLLVVTEPLYRYRFTAVSTTGGARRERAIETERTKRLALQARFGVPLGDSADVAAGALYERAAVRVWAGRRPAIVGDLVRMRLVGLRPRRLRLLAWSVAATVSPRVVRRATGAVAELRDWRARRRLGSRTVCRWSFPPP
jgi:glycosyltransferase involved in cell wall biosynthesis